MNTPSISVIIPVYNGAAYLAEAITSVRQQTHPAQEIIVVDDGSTDRTAAIAQSFAAIRYVQQSNQGPAAARNTGLRLAQGNVIGWLDADDYWPPTRLESHVAALPQTPSPALVMGYVQCQKLTVNSAGQERFERFSNPSLMTSLGSTLIRQAAFEEVGFFDPQLRHSEDLDWFLRARELQLPFLVVPGIALFYRLHHNNMSRAKGARDAAFLAGLKQSLQRRRSARGVVTSLPSLLPFKASNAGVVSHE